MRTSLLGLVLVALGGCPKPPPAGPPLPTRVIDLTPTVEAEVALQVTEQPIYTAMANVTLFNHHGAHYDPPSHLIRDGRSADQTAVDKFVGPARLLDFRDKPRDAGLTRADFEGRVAPGDVVIAYIGCAALGDTCPYLTGEAAEYLASVPIRAYATDGWTISNTELFEKFYAMNEAGESARSEDYVPEHLALLSRDIPNFEGLSNLDALLGVSDAVFVGLPLKLKDGNGAPARVVAFVY